MKISLIQIGKTVQPYLIEGIQEYQSRLKHYCNFEVITLATPKGAAQQTTNKNSLKTLESNLILSKISPADFVALLDERGKEYSSVGFSEFINRHQINATKHMVFVIGGAYGFSEGLYERSNLNISLSKLTFSHQMVRLFFVEQLYRAFTIIKGESYHNE